MLIGSTNSGDPFPLLQGPDNDVKLLYTSLVARGVADDDIALMIGRFASRAEIAKMFKETLGAGQLRRPAAASLWRQFRSRP